MSQLRLSLCCSALAVLGVLASLGLLADAPSVPGKFALLVGVNEYNRRGFTKLEYAEKDADELGKALRKLGFETVVLKGSAANRANIEKQLEALLKKVKHKNDVVLLAFSGHGQELKVKRDGKEVEQPFFCPVDAVLNDAATQLGLSHVINDLLADKGGKNLILVDACRSQPKDAGRGRGIQGKVVALPKNTAVLFSCQAEQESFETDKAGGGHGIFTYCVLERLRRKGGKGGELTWTGLVKHVEDRMGSAEVQGWMPKGREHEPIVAGHVGRTLLARFDAGTPPDKVEVKKEDPGRVEVKLKSGKKLVMHFCKVPKGKFMMGSPKEEKGRDTDEDQREVEITKDYWLGKTEVTRGQFAAFVAEMDYETEAEKGDGAYGWDDAKKNWKKDKSYCWKNPGFAQTDEHPVVCVSWNDASAFCKWMAEKSGKPVRLPTEAEWERACRGGTSTRYHFGDDEEDLARYANVADASFRKATTLTWGIKADDGHAFTAPVASFTKNQYGLHDMHGNAWEWCLDYSGPYKDITDNKDPIGSKKEGEDERRVLRGGSWGNNPVSARAAQRSRNAPANRYDTIGFRASFRLD
jgi:formylglycine-generating enzyme required for sulfatase activity